MPPQVDLKRVTPRAPLIVTTSYVASPWFNAKDYGQLVLYPAIALGSLTTVELVIEFSPDQGATAASIYQESDETNAATSNLDTRAVNQVVHQFSVSGNYRLAVPVADFWFRVKVKGTGTVTSSSVGVDGVLGKTYS